MAAHSPNITPACSYPVKPALPTGDGAKGESTGGQFKPTQRPSNR